ncbi:MAG: transposase [Leptolyngbyaceae cyanobacterium MO_188.B28]|nr:transposase [Leptolyngbyaceae cyanobacterium MO_188.B28]
MPRRKTDLIPGNYYHLYNRGNNRQNIFFERDNYLFFLRQFRRYLVEQTLYVIAYCLMPNHYHFLVQLRKADLSEKIGAFSISYTKAINRLHQRCGTLFQGRFQAIHVEGEEYWLNLSRYIHLNPVKAGLVKRPEDWEFSSYQEYTELRQGTLPKFEAVRHLVGTAQEYREFVESNETDLIKIQHLLFDE